MKSEVNDLMLMLGGNVGNTSDIFDRALMELQKHIGSLVRTSQRYVTEPWGEKNQRHYLNQAVQMETLLTPQEVLNNTRNIESLLGKDKKEPNGPRSIDIDIMFYGNLVLHLDHLQIPHPRLHLRRFNLVPMNEIAPGFMHPVLKLPVHKLLELCPDHSNVEPLHPVR